MLEPGSSVSERRLRSSGQDGILRDDAETRGWNGAALAAFGEMVVDFFGAEVPLPDRRDGVKLGESTLNRFLLLYMVAVKLFVADTELFAEERKGTSGLLICLICRVYFQRIVVECATYYDRGLVRSPYSWTIPTTIILHWQIPLSSYRQRP